MHFYIGVYIIIYLTLHYSTHQVKGYSTVLQENQTFNTPSLPSLPTYYSITTVHFFWGETLYTYIVLYIQKKLTTYDIKCILLICI